MFRPFSGGRGCRFREEDWRGIRPPYGRGRVELAIMLRSIHPFRGWSDIRHPLTNTLISERVIGRGHGHSVVGVPMTPRFIVGYSRVVFGTHNDEVVVYLVVENDWYGAT